MGIFKNVLSLLGIFLAIPLVVLLTLAVKLPLTISGIGYLLGVLLVGIGLIVAPRMNRYYILITVGVFVVALVAGARILLIGQDPVSGLGMIALPQGKTSSWISAVIDEQDGLIFGEALFHQIGGDSNNEHEGLASALLADYSDMRKLGVFPSPIVSTYLGLQGPDHFDAIVIEPEEQPRFGVVFLHGFMGNVTAQCWEIAQAVKRLGGVTVCPSTVWTGEWWQPDGQAILRATFEYLQAQGMQRFYLGGFSNGGFGISRLASLWKKEKGLVGLFFIDGFTDGMSIREVGLPVLIIEGTKDERVPVPAARQFAAEVGNIGTYVELEGDHFLIMKHPDLVQNEIGKWLTEQESMK